MGVLVPSPAVVVIDELILGHGFDTSFSLEAVGICIEIDSLEVVILGLIPVGDVPENTNVLQGQVVPFVVIWVVWNLVVVDILSGSEHTSNFDELPRVDLSWSIFLLSQVSWDPASVDDDGSSLDLDWVTSSEELLHGDLTALIAVEWVDNIKSIDTLSILLWDEDLLGVI